MKRFRILVTSGFVAAVIVGCDSGLKEGVSTEPPPASGQTPDFKAEQQKNAGNMMLKNARPKPGQPGYNK
jgi:hypothetical protein